MSSPFLQALGSPSLNTDFALMDESFDFGLMGEQDYLKQEIECITGSDSESSSPNSPFYPPINPMMTQHQQTNIHNNNNTNTIINNNTNTNNMIAMNNINNNINNNPIYHHNTNNNNNPYHHRIEEMPSKIASIGEASIFGPSGNLWTQLMMPMLAAAAAAASGGNANAAAIAARQFLNIKRSESVKSQMAIERPPAPVSVPTPPLPVPSVHAPPAAPLAVIPSFTPFVSNSTETPRPPSISSSICSSVAYDHSSGEESMDGESDDRSAPSDVKRKRLARKAELARMSRKRKKTRMGDLEAEVERLQKEIVTLKKQIASDDAAAAAAASSSASLEEDEVKKVYATIGCVIEAHARVDPHNENHSKQLLNAMDQFVHTHTRSVHQGANHLSALRPHLSPILPLHFLHWIMSQQDRFYEDPSSLWSSLFLNELRLTSDQMKDLSALRTTVKKQGKLLTDIDKGYRKLSTALKKQLTQRVENLEKIRSILTTNQLAKFLTWVNQYGPLCLQKNDYTQNANSS